MSERTLHITRSFEEAKSIACGFFKEAEQNSVRCSSGWFRCLEDGADVQPPVFVLLKNSGRVEAFCALAVTKAALRGRYALTCSKVDGGGMVIRKYSPEVVSTLLSGIERFARDSGFVTATFCLNQGQDLGLAGMLTEQGYSLSHINCDLVLRIPGKDVEMLDLFSTSRRNEVRQARGRDCRVEAIEDSDTFLDLFHPLYLESMGRKNVLPKSREHLAAVLGNNRDSFLCLVAFFEDRPVGAVAILMDDPQGTAYYYYSAMGFDGKRHRPMERLVYEAVCQAQERGYKRFNFMATSADFRSGVYLFKRQWGAEPVPNIYYRKSYNSVYRLYTLVSDVKRRCVGGVGSKK